MCSLMPNPSTTTVKLWLFVAIGLVCLTPLISSPVALLMGLLFTLFFIWAVKSGQYDDLDSPSTRILIEEE